MEEFEDVVKQGREYRLINGGKMTQIEPREPHGLKPWLGSDGIHRSDTGVAYDHHGCISRSPADIASEWKDRPMVQMKQGQEYKRRDGAKVTQDRRKRGDTWIGSDGVERDDDGKSEYLDLPHDIIAEWPSEPEGKTLAELDVKPGDVVRAKTSTSAQEISHQDERGRWFSDNGCLRNEAIWLLVSRASDKDTAEDKPKWGEWIGWNGGECPVDYGDYVQTLSTSGGDPVACLNSEGNAQYHSWGDVVVYRTRKEPVKGMVTITGNGKEWREDNFFSLPVSNRTHNLTFPTTDGTPITGTYTNAAGDTITLEEIDNAG